MSLPRRLFRLPHPALLAGLLWTAAVTCPAAEPVAQELPPLRWWFGMQVGWAAVLEKHGPTSDSGSVHKGAVLGGGVRIARHTRLGLQIGGISLGKAACPVGDMDCGSRTQDARHTYLTLVNQPRGGTWVYELSAGLAFYELLEKSAARYDEYSLVEDTRGWGVRLSVGQDTLDVDETRPVHRRTHLGWRASVEHANPGRRSGNLGSTAHTTINLTVGVSWH
jgi:hypothetical protein